MLITFEGIDGSGKSTQIKLLADYFISNRREVVILREPGGTIFSEKIRELLLSKDYNLNPITELFLFEAARADLVEKTIKPSLDEGKVVLCDRFYDSTTAYQGHGREISIDDISRSNIMATLGIKPDITFFLDITIEKSIQRTRYKDPDRIELSGGEFFSRVLEGFHDIANKEPERVFIIDSEGSINETHNKIIEILNRQINTLNI